MVLQFYLKSLQRTVYRCKSKSEFGVSVLLIKKLGLLNVPKNSAYNEKKSYARSYIPYNWNFKKSKELYVST